MTVEADGSIFSGGNAVEAALALESAGASAVGINCSVGPDQLVSVVRNIKEAVSIPVIAKPNAGMPLIDEQGNAVYNMTPAEFAQHMKVLVENGASKMCIRDRFHLLFHKIFPEKGRYTAVPFFFPIQIEYQITTDNTHQHILFS